MAPRGPFAKSPSSVATLETTSSKQSNFGFNPYTRTGHSSTSGSDAGSVRSGRSVGSRASGDSRGGGQSSSRATTPRATTPRRGNDRAMYEENSVCSEEQSVSSRLMQEGVRGGRAMDRTAYPDELSESAEQSSQNTPRAQMQKDTSEIGIKEGYHGVVHRRTQTNRRLFGLSPCMRSNVDEIVFGRDMDCSGGTDHSAEMHHLLSMFSGAAGGHAKATAVLLDGDEAPDKPRAPCLRPAAVIEEQGRGDHAGLQSNERKADKKRAWRTLPQSKSTVAEVVFGRDASDAIPKEQMMVSQFERSAGHSPRIRHGEVVEKPGHTPTDVKTMSSKRNYYHSPMNKSQMERLVNNTDIEKTHRRSNKALDAHAASQFDGAAGTSTRWMHDASRRAAAVGPVDPSFCVFMQSIGSVSRA